MVRPARARVLSVLILLAVAASTAHGERVLLQFTSPTCGPCRQMRPAIQQLAGNGFPVRMVDVSREPQTAAQYGVDAWPTSILLVDDVEQTRNVGPMTYQQLVQFVDTPSNVRMQSPNGGGVSPLVHSGGTRSSVADQPVPGRIADIGSGRRPDRTVAEPSAARTPAPTRPSRSAIGHAQLIESTVRLSVDDPYGRSSGTGTMIDTFNGETLVLTCGHIFRSSEGQGDVAVTLFRTGASGPEVRETVAGRLLDFDLDRDLALVAIKAKGPVRIAPVGPAGTVLTPQSPVVSVGCDHGQDPTALSTQITSIDRYVGTPNVEIAGAPVEGRSGGGLFDAEGRVIGVCFAADPEGNEGLYVSLPAIQKKLDELRLTAVYEDPSTAKNAMTVLGQSPESWPPAMPELESVNDSIARRQSNEAVAQAQQAHPAEPLAATLEAATGNLQLEEQAAIEEIIRRGAKSEVVCIIRPQDADESSEVIRIDGASPQFLQALQAMQEANARR